MTLVTGFHPIRVTHFPMGSTKIVKASNAMTKEYPMNELIDEAQVDEIEARG